MNKLELSRLESNFLFNPKLLFLRYIVDKVEYIFYALILFRL